MTATLAPGTEGEQSQPPPVRLDSRYRLLNVLRETRDGQTWTAIDERLDRHVAVHLLGPDRSPQRPGRFERRVNTLAALNHRAIVRLFDAHPGTGQRAGADAPMLVTELADGPTLAQRLEAGPMDGPSALRLARDVAAAVAYLHTHGITTNHIDPHHILMYSSAATWRAGHLSRMQTACPRPSSTSALSEPALTTRRARCRRPAGCPFARTDPVSLLRVASPNLRVRQPPGRDARPRPPRPPDRSRGMPSPQRVLVAGQQHHPLGPRPR